MDEISCPMCGKANPKELDICQFCQARLKPLLVAPNPSEDEPGNKQPSLSGISPIEESIDQDVDLPDWLRELRGIESKPSDEETSDETVPGWLIENDREIQIKPAADAETKAADWLESLRENGDVTPESTLEEQKPLWEDEESLPGDNVGGEDLDWLQRIRTRHLAETEPEETPPNSSSSIEDVPAWLVEAESRGFKEAPPPTVSMEESDLPDWLKKLDATYTEKPAIQGESVEDITEAGPPTGNVPALIFDENELFPFLDEDQPAQVMPEGSEFQEESASEGSQMEAEPAVGEGNEGPVTAQIPGWLQAMRPVEIGAPSSPIPVEEDKEPERAGPLAGLRGVLPAEPDILRIRKPPVYSVKLQVTESQQANVALLQELIASESEARPTRGRPALSSPYLFRLAIAITLFVVLGWTLWPGNYQGRLPSTRRILPEIADAFRLSSSFPTGAPVLMVFDYEPRLSGEMNGLASSMVSQLSRSGAYLATTSTSPTGPLLAQVLLNSFRDQAGEIHFSNLGFLPGGITGIAGFARNPVQVLPYDISGVNAWEADPLSRIRRLSDFALIVVITDDAAVAQAWIEQLQPALQGSNKSLIMVTSAQVEPVIRPYYETLPKQVNGLVSGLGGAAALERLNGLNGQATQQWNVLGAGLSVAVIFILLGALYSLLSTRLGKVKTFRWGGRRFTGKPHAN